MIYDHRNEHVPNKAELVEAVVPGLEKVITESMPTSEEEAITDNIITEAQRELAQAVAQHTAEVQEEVQETAVPAGSRMDTEEKEEPETVSQEPVFDVEDLQRELANSMREIVSGMTRKESEEGVIEPMNDKPFHEEKASVEPEKPQVNIDDVLTAMAVEAEPPMEAAVTLEKQESPSVEEAQPAPQERKEETEEPQMQTETVPAGDTIDLSAALERAAGVENMRPGVSEESPVPEQPKKEEPLDAAPKLTLDEQYIFSYFSSIQGLREQIAMALADAKRKLKMDRTSRSGNIVVTGLPGSGRTTLAIRIAKSLSKFKGESSARIAKIYAEDFNKKDIASTIAKIAGGTLIIEEAGDLAEGVILQLSKAMEFRTDGLIIILEDEKHLLKALFEKYPALAEKFTSEVTVPIFTNDELVAFGKTYAFEEDYKVDDAATMVLYNRIGELQTPERPVTVLDVKDIVDQAIKNTERFGVRKLGMILSKKRYDEDDRIILYEKDFK